MSGASRGSPAARRGVGWKAYTAEQFEASSLADYYAGLGLEHLAIVDALKVYVTLTTEQVAHVCMMPIEQALAGLLSLVIAEVPLVHDGEFTAARPYADLLLALWEWPEPAWPEDVEDAKADTLASAARMGVAVPEWAGKSEDREP